MTRLPALSFLFFLAALLFVLGPIILRAVPHEAVDPSEPESGTEPGHAGPPASGEGVDFLTPFFALDPSVSVESGAARAAFNPADPHGGLPQTEGYELVAAQCSACHSLGVVMQQSLSQGGWDAVLRAMVEKRGMVPPDPADRAAILDYLAAHFAPAAPN